jgi:hypothetical protein
MLSAYQSKICHLPAKGIGTMEFNMPPERMDAVRRAGDAAMEAFLAGDRQPALRSTEAATP